MSVASASIEAKITEQFANLKSKDYYRPMPRVGPIAGLIAALALLAAVIGCGSSESPDPANNPTSHQPAAPSETPQGTSKDFISPGGENKYAEFGQEASTDEAKAASVVADENLTAREKADWTRQCSTLSPKAIRQLGLSGAPASPKATCEENLKSTAEPLSSTKAIRADTLDGPISVLMVEGKQAYALYHDKTGANYALPMEEVDGTWKVASLVTLKFR